MSPLIKGFFAYPPSCHAGHEGVKELRRIEQTLAGCLKNHRFIDTEIHKILKIPFYRHLDALCLQNVFLRGRAQVFV